MANRYDTPVQLDFINTYVPIPFEQLYNLGKAANDRVDKALSDFTTALDKFGEFRSRSAIDMQRWNDLTINPQKALIEQMAKNPELIKDRAFQSQLKSSIANVDRTKLSLLKQNAAAYDEYEKLKQQLMIAGKYNPTWHDIDFSNYDTLGDGLHVGKGLFEATPMPYADLNELSKPYMDQLKPGFLRSDGVYDYTGIAASDLERVANAHLTDIANTPQGQMHMQMFMRNNPDATPEQALTWLRNAIIDSNQDRLIKNRTINPLYALSIKSNGKKSGSGSDTPANPPVMLSTKLAASMSHDKLSTGNTQIDKARNWFAEDSEKRNQYLNNSDSSGKITTRSQNAKSIINGLFQSVGSQIDFVNNAELPSNEYVKSLDGRRIYSGTGKVGMMTQEAYVNAKMGIPAQESGWDAARLALEEDIMTGNIPGVGIIPTDKLFTEQTYPGQESFTQEYRLLIPLSYFEKTMPDTFEWGLFRQDETGEDLLAHEGFQAFIKSLNGNIPGDNGKIANTPSLRLDDDGTFSAGSDVQFNGLYVEIPVVKGVLNNESTRDLANQKEFQDTNMGTNSNREYRETNEEIIYGRE